MQKPLKRIVIEDVGGDMAELNDHSSNQSTTDQDSASTIESIVCNSTTSSIEETQTMISKKEIAMTKEELEPELLLPAETKKSVENGNESKTRDSLELELQAPPIVKDTTPAKVDTTLSNDSEESRAVEIIVKTAASQMVLSVPDVPDSSLQFQADWKKLRRDKNVLAEYFKVCNMYN